MSSDVMKDYEEYKAAGRVWGQVPPDRIKKIKFPRIPKEIADRFLALEDMTTNVSDALDTFGVQTVVPASYLPPLSDNQRMVGNVVTLRSIPERKTPTQGVFDKDPIKMSTREVYYLSEPGDVLVADFGGDKNVSNMGGMSCKVGQTSGFAGAIVNGAVRDVDGIRALNYPVWAVGRTPITGKFRIEAIEINGPVTVHNVVVYAGDFVVADSSGICFVPHELVQKVLDYVEATEAAENKMRGLIDNKRPISELKPLFRARYNGC
jgi:4-hydroxy-4-methyl-2-oxoglutarate aldolase